MRLVTKRRVGVELQRIFGKPKWGTVILSSETMCESAKGFDQISLCQLTQNTHLTDYTKRIYLSAPEFVVVMVMMDDFTLLNNFHRLYREDGLVFEDTQK